LQLHTPFVSVFLNSPVHFTLDLQTGAAASGPGSHAQADFNSASFKLPTGTDAFNLPEGVTVNAGNYLVGDLSQAALLHDRWAPRIEVATTNEDDFLRNIVAIRCEARMALAVHQPAALRKGTF